MGKALNMKINFQVDSTQAKQQLQSLQTQINSITKASSFSANSQFGITSQILEATKAAAQLKTALAEAVNPLTGNLNLTKFNDQLRASGMSLTDYRNQLLQLGSTGNQAFNSLTKSIMTAETPLLRTGKAAQQMWTVLGNTLRWQATSSLLHGIMSTASQAMSYVKSLDSSLNSIRIVTGQSEEQMERFAKSANKAAKELNTSTNAYAQASLIYYQQGLSNKQVEERTATTIKLANVAGQSAKTVSDQMTAVWNNFYDGSKSLEYYADVITALGASTASSSEEIAKGLQKFSSIAQTTGLSYEYATSALATVVAATRQSADSVGTSFKTLFSRLQGLSLGETLEDGTTLNKYSKALLTIGVNIKDATGNLKDMDSILDEIGQKWQYLDKAEQVALAQTVGGVRNYTGLVSLMDNWDKFQTNLKTAQTAQGTLQAQADIYAESWEAASKHVKAASETIYKNLLDDNFFKGLTNGFGTILDMIGSLTNSLGGFKGTMYTLGNTAFQLFGNQIANSFANIGLTIHGMTAAGRQEVLNLKTEAMNAIADYQNFSAYVPVNQLQQAYGRSFNERQVLYDDLVERGRIPEYQRPAYQMMFNAVNDYNEQAILAAEESYALSDKAYLSGIRGQQAFNYATRNSAAMALESQQALANFATKYNLSADDLKKFPNFVKAYDMATSPNSSNQTRAWNENLLNMHWRSPTGGWSKFTPDMINEYQAYENYSANQRAAFAESIENYRNAFMNEEIAGKLNIAMGTRAEGVITQQDAIRTAGYITRVVEGSKQYGLNLGAQIPQLDAVNKQIAEQTDLLKAGTITQEQYATSIQKIITDAGDLQTWVNDILATTSDTGSEVYRSNLIDQVQKYQGLSFQDAKAQVNEILNDQKLDITGRMAAIDKIGGAGAANQALKDTLLQQAKMQQGINMSSALSINLGAMASLGQVLQSGANAFKVFSNENATAGEQLSAFTSLTMAGSMAIKPFTEFMKAAPLPVKVFGKELGITNGALGGMTLGLAALAVGIKTYVNEVQRSSNAAAVKGLTTAIATATQAVSNAQEKYDNLLTGRETQNNLLTKLNSLQKGTQDFTLALLNANEAARNLIEEYDLQYGTDYNYGANNEIILNQASLNAAEEAALKDLEDTTRGKAVLSYAENLLNIKEQSAEITEYSDRANQLLEKQVDIAYQQTDLASWQLNPETGENEYITPTGMSAFSVQELIDYYAESSSPSFQAFLTNPQEAFSFLANGNWTEEQQQSFYEGLQAAFGVDNAEAAINIIQGLKDEGWATATITERQDKLAKVLNDESYQQGEIYQQRYAAAQGMLETIAQGAENQDDLTKFVTAYMANDPDFLAHQEAIAKAMYTSTEESLMEKVRTFFGSDVGDMQEAYRRLYGVSVVPKELVDNEDLLKNRVATKMAEQLEFEGITDTTRRWAGKEVSEALADFEGINEVRQNLIDNNQFLQGLTSYTSQNIEDILNQASLISYQASITDDEKLQGLYNSITDTLFKEVTSTESNLLASLANYSNLSEEEIQSNFANLVSGYNLTQLGTISTYLTQAGSVFGSGTVQNILGQINKTANQRTLDNLAKVNWDDTFSALGDINRLANNVGGHENLYSEILEGAIGDLGAEGGIFQKLYNSSGFQDVLTNLTEQFDTMGEITTGYVVKLAQKNEDLNAVLSLSNSAFGDLNINAAGLASLFTAINAGQIQVGEVTSSLLSSLSTAGALEAEKYNAFNIVDNQDLGRSGTDLLEYFTNGQKAYLNAKTQNLTFDTPLRSFFDHLMPTSVRNAYYEANVNGNNKTFTDIIKTLPQEVQDFLDKTNKKGTKSALTWSDVIDLYGGFINGTAIPEEWLNPDSDIFKQFPNLMTDLGSNPTLMDYMREVYGLTFQNGNIQLYDLTGDGKYEFTTEQTKANLTDIFSQFMSPEDAENMASLWTAYIGETSAGTQLLANDAAAAFDVLKNQKGNLYSDGTTGGKTIYSENALKTAFFNYGSFLGYGATPEEQQRFISDILGANEGATITPSLATGFWSNTDAKALTASIGAAYQEANKENETLQGLSNTEAFEQLMADFGASEGVNGRINFDRLSDLISFLGGTEANLTDILDNNEELFGRVDTVFTDRFGKEHTIERDEGEKYSDYITRVNRERNAAESEWFQIPGTDQVIHDPLGIYRQQYDEEGNWTGEGQAPTNIPRQIMLDKEGNMVGLTEDGRIIHQNENGEWTDQKSPEVIKAEEEAAAVEAARVAATAAANQADSDLEYQADLDRLQAQEEAAAAAEAAQTRADLKEKYPDLTDYDIDEYLDNGSTFEDIDKSEAAAVEHRQQYIDNKEAEEAAAAAAEHEEAVATEAEGFLSENPVIGPEALQVAADLAHAGAAGLPAPLTAEEQRENFVNAIATAYNLSPEQVSDQLLQMEAAAAQENMPEVTAADIDAIAGGQEPMLIPGLWEGLAQETISSFGDFFSAIKALVTGKTPEEEEEEPGKPEEPEEEQPEIPPEVQAELDQAAFEQQQRELQAAAEREQAQAEIDARTSEINELKEENANMEASRDGTNDWIINPDIAKNNQAILEKQFESDLIKYQGLSSPEERLAAQQEALEKAQNGQQLSAFEKTLLSTLDNLDENIATQTELSEAEAEAAKSATGGKKAVGTNEDGELIDEEGNVIELPYESPQPTSGGGGSDYQGGGGGTQGNKPTYATPDGHYFDDDGNQYMPGGDGTWIPVKEEEEPEPEPAPSSGGCFAPGTQILMANGQNKNIEDVKIGEFIIAYDEEKQEFVTKKVMDSYPHYNTPKLVKLTFDNNETVELTPGHPLYSTNGWKSLDIANSLYEHKTIASLLKIGDIILGMNKAVTLIDIEYLNIGSEYTSYNIEIKDCHTFLANGFIAHNAVSKRAVGQRNKIPAFASGTGEVAVTGELGPELRIKSDGSMDMLGEHGREYAWVEPSDRIYTAAQTTSILHNNNIPELQQFAEGFNNKIRGFAASQIGSTDNPSSSGGSGGGGGGGATDEKDPRYDPNTLKIRDILERYYTILQQIDDITRAVERFAAVADRAWGVERTKAIEKQSELIKDQIKAQEKYVNEIEEYLNVDESALTTMMQEFVSDYNESMKDAEGFQAITWQGAEFDENGVLTNYRDFVEKLVEQYNQNAEENAKNKEVQYKFQEQLKDIQKYTETLNLYESERQKLEELRNNYLDTIVKKIVVQLDYENELDNNELVGINYQLNKVKDNAWRAAEAIDYYAQKMEKLDDSNERYKESIKDILSTYSGNVVTGKQHSLTTTAYELNTKTEADFGDDKAAWEAYQKDLEENWHKVQIGDKTYYQPMNDKVEVKDYFTKKELSDVKLDYKGQITADSKKDITAQVEQWYKELQAANPEAAVEIELKYDENHFLTNYREVLEKINKANAKMSDEMYELLLTDTETFFEKWAEVTGENIDFQDLTTETAKQLENSISQIYSNLEQKQGYLNTMMDYLGDSAKEFNKEMNSALGEFDYYGSVLQSYESIINLTNRRSTNIGEEYMKNLRSNMLDNSINKLSGSKTNYDTSKANLAQAQKVLDAQKASYQSYVDSLAGISESQLTSDQKKHRAYLQDMVDKAQDNFDKVNQVAEEAHKDYLKSWEDALSKISENYKSTIEEASKTFESSFSPFFSTFELLQAQFDREKELGDLYVDNYQSIHDLNKLNRDINQSILDTDNLKSKERLRELQKEINDLQKDGTKLSAYDLDILDKKYKVELARQDLEDAKNAKSLVRLSRDNNGNWSYVYTSNEDEVDEAEQRYEDAIRDMEEANENYIDNLETQIIQVQQKAQQAIEALKPEDFATYDDYLAAVENIQKSMYETLDFLRNQLNNAFGNNEWLDPYIVDREGKNDHDLTTKWDQMTLAAVTGIKSLNDAVNTAKDNLGDMITTALEAYTEYSEKQKEVYEEAGHDIGDAAGTFQAGIEEMAKASAEQVGIVEDLSKRIEQSFADTSAAIEKNIQDIYEETRAYEQLCEVMTKFLELSGEYVPKERVDFSSQIDTQKELNMVKEALAAYGEIIVTAYDENNERQVYNLKENDEETAKLLSMWESKISAIDVGEDVDTREEYNKINKYLEEHGHVYVKINGEIVELRKDNAEDMAKLQEWLAKIEAAEKKVVSNTGGGGTDYSNVPYGWVLVPGGAQQLNNPASPSQGTTGVTYDISGGIVNPKKVLSGGYTGRWQSALTGMYTGEWPDGSVERNGRWALLHQKELVLNAHDTENFLDAMQIVRELDNLANWMANGLGDLFTPRISYESGQLEQNVHIDASFPNVTDHNEIEEAFDNLVNLASQYANRK